jgi:hypothetical protein
MNCKFPLILATAATLSLGGASLAAQRSSATLADREETSRTDNRDMMATRDRDEAHRRIHDGAGDQPPRSFRRILRNESRTMTEAPRPPRWREEQLAEGRE